MNKTLKTINALFLSFMMLSTNLNPSVLAEPEDHSDLNEISVEEIMEEEYEEPSYDGQDSEPIDDSSGQDKADSNTETVPESFVYEEEIIEEETEYEPEAAPAETFIPAVHLRKTIDDITVSVEAEEGVFPDNVQLFVTRVEENLETVEAAVEEIRDDNVNVAVSYTFDIVIADEYGNELQPEEGANVKVSFEAAEVEDQNLTTAVYHIEENNNALN